VDAVWRIESPRLIAGLTRVVHDIGVAEELAQDALVAALEQWPESGVPDNPGAWLMATAKHRAIDHLLTGRRNLGERAAAAHKNIKPEFVLEQFELLADRRLRRMQLFGGSGDVHAVLRDGGEIAQLLKLHGAAR